MLIRASLSVPTCEPHAARHTGQATRRWFVLSKADTHVTHRSRAQTSRTPSSSTSPPRPGGGPTLTAAQRGESRAPDPRRRGGDGLRREERCVTQRYIRVRSRNQLFPNPGPSQCCGGLVARQRRQRQRAPAPPGPRRRNLSPPPLLVRRLAGRPAGAGAPSHAATPGPWWHRRPRRGPSGPKSARGSRQEREECM